MIYKFKIPAVNCITIEVLAKNREEAVEKAFKEIKNKEIKNKEWKFVKNIKEAMEYRNIIASRIYINESHKDEFGCKYLISIPCSGYTITTIESTNEIDAINKSLMNLRFNKGNIHNVEPHEDILLDIENILNKN